jgi:hypothetical protein
LWIDAVADVHNYADCLQVSECKTPIKPQGAAATTMKAELVQLDAAKLHHLPVGTFSFFGMSSPSSAEQRRISIPAAVESAGQSWIEWQPCTECDSGHARHLQAHQRRGVPMPS